MLRLTFSDMDQERSMSHLFSSLNSLLPKLRDITTLFSPVVQSSSGCILSKALSGMDSLTVRPWTCSGTITPLPLDPRLIQCRSSSTTTSTPLVDSSFTSSTGCGLCSPLSAPQLPFLSQLTSGLPSSTTHGMASGRSSSQPCGVTSSRSSSRTDGLWAEHHVVT